MMAQYSHGRLARTETGVRTLALVLGVGTCVEHTRVYSGSRGQISKAHVAKVESCPVHESVKPLVDVVSGTGVIE